VLAAAPPVDVGAALALAGTLRLGVERGAQPYELAARGGEPVDVVRLDVLVEVIDLLEVDGGVLGLVGHHVR
jgi:hypothetical protein